MTSTSEPRYAPPPLVPPRSSTCPICDDEPDLAADAYECGRCGVRWPLSDVGEAPGEWRSDLPQCASTFQTAGTSLVSPKVCRCLLPVGHAGPYHRFMAPLVDCAWSDRPVITEATQ